jgi:3',5'-nucleoside bisphosphate phosphatase
MTQLDLHSHTTASDGQLSPAELVALARQIGLTTLGITDHDTTDGVEPAHEAAGDTLVIIPGVELSAEDEAGDVHTLGYFIDIHNKTFQEKLEWFRAGRYYRGQEIVKKLAALGMLLDWSRIEAIADGGSIGRPHIARAMLEAGYVKSIQDAFDKYIDNDGPAYVARSRLSPEEAVEMIHEAGGAAVLAHPGLLDDYETMIERLVPVGLDGVEVVYPKHSNEVELRTRLLANRHGLIVTGGSDFHGLNLPGKAMLGSVNPPVEAVDALRERAKKYTNGISL